MHALRELAALRSRGAPRAARGLRVERSDDVGLSSETVSDLAEEIGEFAIDANGRLSLATMDKIRAVTAQDVRDVARRVLKNERRVFGWCLPKNAATKAAQRSAQATTKKAAKSAQRKPAAKRSRAKVVRKVR